MYVRQILMSLALCVGISLSAQPVIGSGTLYATQHFEDSIAVVQLYWTYQLDIGEQFVITTCIWESGEVHPFQTTFGHATDYIKMASPCMTLTYRLFKLNCTDLTVTMVEVDTLKINLCRA